MIYGEMTNYSLKNKTNATPPTHLHTYTQTHTHKHTLTYSAQRLLCVIRANQHEEHFQAFISIQSFCDDVCSADDHIT